MGSYLGPYYAERQKSLGWPMDSFPVWLPLIVRIKINNKIQPSDDRPKIPT